MPVARTVVGTTNALLSMTQRLQREPLRGATKRFNSVRGSSSFDPL